MLYLNRIDIFSMLNTKCLLGTTIDSVWGLRFACNYLDSQMYTWSILTSLSIHYSLKNWEIDVPKPQPSSPQLLG